MHQQELGSMHFIVSCIKRGPACITWRTRSRRWNPRSAPDLSAPCGRERGKWHDYDHLREHDWRTDHRPTSARVQGGDESARTSGHRRKNVVNFLSADVVEIAHVVGNMARPRGLNIN